MHAAATGWCKHEQASTDNREPLCDEVIFVKLFTAKTLLLKSFASYGGFIGGSEGECVPEGAVC